MNFRNKTNIVKDTQQALGVKSDGIPGPVTWRAIEGQITNNNSGATNRARILNVQRFLNLVADGIDGPATWNAILNHLRTNQQPTRPPTTISKFEERVQLSKQTTGPYARRITPSAIVLHHTNGNYLGSVSWTNNIYNEKGERLYASYHCIIARDGRRTITNEDTNRAYHAGPSSFRGRSGMNMWSIGVAWERDTYNEPLSEAAINSALEYIIPIMKKWNITPDWVTDHRTVSPGRKVDIAPREYDRFMVRLREEYNKG